jgi:hypothetical protein
MAANYDYGKSSGVKEFLVFNEPYLYYLTTSELIDVKGKTLLELFKADADKIPTAYNKAKKAKLKRYRSYNSCMVRKDFLLKLI